MHNKKCRICFHSLDQKCFCSINTKLFYSFRTLKQMLVDILPVMKCTLKDDQLICEDCLPELEISYNFFAKCLSAESNIKAAENLSIIGDKQEGAVNVNEKFRQAYVALEKNIHLDLNESINIVFDKSTVKSDSEFSKVIGCSDSDSPEKDADTVKVIDVSAKNDDSDGDSILDPPDNVDVKGNNLIMKNEIIDLKTESEEISFTDHDDNDNEKIDKELLNEIWQCRFCESDHPTAMSLNLHFDAVHKKDNVYKCNICYRSYILLRKFQDHNCKPLYCQPCDLSFTDPTEFRKHQLEHRYHLCEICGRRFKTSTNLSDHMQYHGNLGPFECDICGNKLSTQGILRQHKKIHTDREKKFACDQCPKKYFNLDALNFHKERHSGLSFQCESCGKKFCSPQSLKHHITVQHEGVRRFGCTLCLKRFSTNWALKLHLNVHVKKVGKIKDMVQERKPRSCPNKIALHIQEENDNLKTKPAQVTRKLVFKTTDKGKFEIVETEDDSSENCPICEKVFSRKRDLTYHMQLSHFPFMCNICDKRFASSEKLNSHYETHQDSSYKCFECKESFGGEDLLDKHMRDIHEISDVEMDQMDD